MVNYNPKNWFSLIFNGFNTQVMKFLLPAVGILGVYTLVLVYLVVDFFELHFVSTTQVHALLGIVMGLFLVFRTNTAYDRWWEGRKLWGSLVNNSRNLASKISVFLPVSDQDSRQFFIAMIPNFVLSLREHLRGVKEIDGLQEVPGLKLHKQVEKAAHAPNLLITLIYKQVNQLYQQKAISPHQFFVLDKELKSFSDILGACERIKNTPIPYSYSMYIKQFIFVYTITLPFAFVTLFKYWTIPIVLLIFATLVSIELIAEEIEDPFGRDVNDLPTNSLSKKIEENVREILAMNVPKPIHISEEQ